MTDKIGTVAIHLEIHSAEQLARLIDAFTALTGEPVPAARPLTGVAARSVLGEAVFSDAPRERLVVHTNEAAAAPAPDAKPAAPRGRPKKANGTPPQEAEAEVVQEHAADAAPAAREPMSKDELRALLGKYKDQYGMAAAVGCVASMGVDHLDALPIERYPELAALLELPPPPKAA